MAPYFKSVKEQSSFVPPNPSVDGRPGDTRAGGLVNRMPPAPNLEIKILDRLKGKAGGVSLIEVRTSLKAGGKAKAEFDEAVLSLYKRRLVYLDRHDHPLRLSDADRRDLVFDGTGNYYVGITLRSDVE